MKKTNFLFLCGALLLTTASVYAGRIGVLGTNTYGQFGTGTTGTTKDVSTVTQIGSDADWIDIASGKYHSLALKANGTLWAWGLNSAGQLGDGSTTNRTAPVQVGTDTHWKQFDGGENFTLAVKTDGTLWAWGDNSYGQFGNGSTTASLTPVQIGTDNDWKQVDCGAFHVLAIKTDGSLWAWGYNSVGQVGNGTTTNQLTPVQIGTDKTWRKIAAGGNTSVALKPDSLLWRWGDAQSSNYTSPNNVTYVKYCEISAGYIFPVGGSIKGRYAGIFTNSTQVYGFDLSCFYYWDSAKKLYLAAGTYLVNPGPSYLASSTIISVENNNYYTYCFVTYKDGKLVSLRAASKSGAIETVVTSTIPWGKPVSGYEHLLVLEQTEQTITFDDLPDKAVGDADFAISATTNAFVYDPIVFTSSDENVAKCTGINGATIQITGVGSCTITATQGGNGCWKAATATQTLKVKTSPVITWSNPADITYGTALSATQLNATADVAGTFTYTPTSGTVLSAGDNQKLLVEFTPTDVANYITIKDSVYINVKKAAMQLKFTTTADNQSISLPLYGTINCSVDWGDGSATESFTTAGLKDHTFTTAGTYTASISGTLTTFGRESDSWTGVAYLTDVISFGDVGLTSLSGAFNNADNLISVPVTLPSTVTDLSYCFMDINQATITNLNLWDVSHVTSLLETFYTAIAFNQDISAWNVSKVTTMANMFYSVTLSTANYDALLKAWAAQSVQPNVVFDGGSSKYTAGAAATARGVLTGTPNNWTITDGGQESVTAVESVIGQLSLQIAPNPTNNQFRIYGLTGDAEIAIWDVTGKVCRRTAVSSTQFVSVGDLAKGLYVVEVCAENNTVRLKLLNN